MSEMSCTWLAENAGRKKSPFWHYRTTLSGSIFAAEHVSTIGKKNLLNLLNVDTSSTCLHNMVNFGHANGWDLLASLGHPCKF